jgi:hypothetical protein
MPFHMSYHAFCSTIKLNVCSNTVGSIANMINLSSFFHITTGIIVLH